MGRALIPKKCFWYLIDQVWSDGKWRYHPTHHTSAILQVCDSKGQLDTILWLQVTEAHQTLGVWLAPDSNSTKEFQYLKTTLTEWKIKMERAYLMHNDTFFSLWSLILHKLAILLQWQTSMRTNALRLWSKSCKLGCLKLVVCNLCLWQLSMVPLNLWALIVSLLRAQFG